MRGVPLLYRTIGGLALIIEEIPGRDMEFTEKEMQLPPTFIGELSELVENIHKRGVAHCDLKRAPNIILGDDGRPYIVDWSASIFRREFPFFPLSSIYRRFVQDDLNAIIKIRLKCHPEGVTPEERRQYLHRNITERFIRSVRDRARNLLQKIS